MTEERLEIALRAIRSSPELQAREVLREFAADVRRRAMIDLVEATEERLAMHRESLSRLAMHREALSKLSADL